MPPELYRIQRTWFIICCGVTLAGAGFVLAPALPHDVALGWAIILGFGNRAVDLYQLLSSAPRPARVDAYGVEIDGCPYGRVEWRDIETASYWRASGRDWLALGVSDPDKYVRRLPTVERFCNFLKPNFGPRTLAIDVSLVLEGGRALYDRVRARLGRGRRAS
jgi:hypothetical protein